MMKIPGAPSVSPLWSLARFKGSNSGTTVQKSEPWEGQKPYLTGLYELGQSAYDQTPKEAFQGPTLAGPTNAQTAALRMAQQQALTAHPGNASQAASAQLLKQGQTGTGQKLGQQGNYQPIQMGQMQQYAPQQMDLEGVQAMSPTTQAAIQASLDPVQERLQEQILPQLKNQSISAGAYGGQREGVVQNQALRDFSREAGNIGAQLGYQDLARRQGIHAQDVGQQRELGLQDVGQQRELGFQDVGQQRELAMADLMSKRENALRGYTLDQAAMQTAGGLAGQGYQQSLMPSQTMQNVGDQQQAWQQARMDDSFNRYVREQQAPWIGIPELQSIVGMGSGFGTSTTQQPTMSRFGTAVSGGLGGAATGAALGSAVPGLGTALGAGLGGAVGLLGGLF